MSSMRASSKPWAVNAITAPRSARAKPDWMPTPSERRRSISRTRAEPAGSWSVPAMRDSSASSCRAASGPTGRMPLKSVTPFRFISSSRRAPSSARVGGASCSLGRPMRAALARVLRRALTKGNLTFYLFWREGWAGLDASPVSSINVVYRTTNQTSRYPMAMAGPLPVQSMPLPKGVEIKPRRMKFAYGESTEHWIANDRVLTRFMEALSMLFPEGERFFVESVNRYKDQIVDPVLLKQVTAFAAQEGMHAAEHHKYNVRAAGPLAERYEAIAGQLRHPIARRILSPMNRLAITVALEHFTAIMADELLRN